MDKKELTAGERFRRFVKGESVDRLPMLEWAPWWDQTVRRWQGEGLDKSLDALGVQRYFGMDGCLQTYFTWRTPQTPHAPQHGHGIIKSAEDYQKIKHTLYRDPTTFYSKEYFDWLKKTGEQEGDTVHWFTVEGFFWMPRELFGIEDHLYAFYDEPDLMHEISYDNKEWLKKVFEFIGNTHRFDFMTFAEDMSYNSGPMIGKNLFDEFLAPYYKELIPLIKQMDVPVVIDSDGDITDAVDWYGSVGAQGMLPLERRAGVDVSKYIEKHPEMFFIGHFDKTCMAKGEDAMRREFERLMPSWQKGKLVPAVDHQTPPDVSMETYKIYVKLFKEYAAKV